MPRSEDCGRGRTAREDGEPQRHHDLEHPLEPGGPVPNGQADVMLFMPARLQVGLGDSVIWENDTRTPQTVTFGRPRRSHGDRQALARLRRQRLRELGADGYAARVRRRDTLPSDLHQGRYLPLYLHLVREPEHGGRHRGGHDGRCRDDSRPRHRRRRPRERCRDGAPYWLASAVVAVVVSAASRRCRLERRSAIVNDPRSGLRWSRRFADL